MAAPAEPTGSSSRCVVALLNTESQNIQRCGWEPYTREEFKFYHLGTRVRSSLPLARCLDVGLPGVYYSSIINTSAYSTLDNLPALYKSRFPYTNPGGSQPCGLHHVILEPEDSVPKMIAEVIWEVHSSKGLNVALEDITLVKDSSWSTIAVRSALEAVGFRKLKSDKLLKNTKYSPSRAPIFVHAPLLFNSKLEKGSPPAADSRILGRIDPNPRLREELKSKLDVVKNSSGDPDKFLRELICFKHTLREIQRDSSHYSADWQVPLALLDHLFKFTINEAIDLILTGFDEKKASDLAGFLQSWEDPQFLNKHNYLSVIDKRAIGGYETPVIIAVVSSADYMRRTYNLLHLNYPNRIPMAFPESCSEMVSRALMHAVLIVPLAHDKSHQDSIHVTNALRRMNSQPLHVSRL